MCLSTQVPPNASCHAMQMIKSEGWHANEKNIAGLTRLLEAFLFAFVLFLFFYYEINLGGIFQRCHLRIGNLKNFLLGIISTKILLTMGKQVDQVIFTK